MELSELRNRIDAIDRELVRLFVERMGISGEVADYKAERGIPIFDAAREEAILDKIGAMAGENGPYAKQLYRTIFSVSRDAQHRKIDGDSSVQKSIAKALAQTEAVFPQKAVVACQGVEGAFSQAACGRVFPKAEIHFFEHFDDVFSAVEQGHCRYGILPIENSAAGSVTQVYDLMKRHEFSIVRSVRLLVGHALLTAGETDITQIKHVYSHRQALNQCSRFLEAHPWIQAHEMENTARAARYISESKRTDAAAIASENCAALYKLSCLQKGIQNEKRNYTRFICISKRAEIFEGANRISLLLTLPHRPGTLQSMLFKLACANINLVKLESRPIPGSEFAFYFYFDLEASPACPQVLEVLGQMEREAEEFHFLGAYREVL